MPLHHRSVWLVYIFTISLLTSCQTLPSNSIGQMLPVGKVNADILAVQFPERATELALELEKAVNHHRDWFFKYTKENARPGVPLPYHPNFGLTEKEYREFLALTEQRTIVVTSQVELTITEEAGIYKISSGGRLPTLDEIIVNTNDNTVSTQFGKLHNPEKTSSDGTDSPIGAFRGYKWDLEEGSIEADNAKIVSFSIYRLIEGKTFIEFRANVLEEGNLVVKEGLALRLGAVTPSLPERLNSAQAPHR